MLEAELASVWSAVDELVVVELELSVVVWLVEELDCWAESLDEAGATEVVEELSAVEAWVESAAVVPFWAAEASEMMTAEESVPLVVADWATLLEVEVEVVVVLEASSGLEAGMEVSPVTTTLFSVVEALEVLEELEEASGLLAGTEVSPVMTTLDSVVVLVWAGAVDWSTTVVVPSGLTTTVWVVVVVVVV